MSIHNRLITTKTLFTISIIVFTIVIIGVWVLGIEDHRTIESNAMISLSILSLIFFTFITTGLYKGLKMKDNLGRLTNKYSFGKTEDNIVENASNTDIDVGQEIGDSVSSGSFDFDFDFGEGIEGIILSIVFWFVATIIIGVFIWLFGTVFWMMTLIILGVLYWIFFRALRLVFKNSLYCKRSLIKSSIYGVGFTLVYSCWLYGLLYLSVILQ